MGREGVKEIILCRGEGQIYRRPGSGSEGSEQGLPNIQTPTADSVPLTLLVQV